MRMVSVFQRPLWTRNTTAVALRVSPFVLLRDIVRPWPRTRILDVARAHIYRRKMQRGRREYSPRGARRRGAVSRGQSASRAKEGTDISRRKRRFRVVVPLFAVGIIIGPPGNPGRAARWLVRFRVRRWKPNDGAEGRATSGIVPGKREKAGICMSEAGRGTGMDKRGWRAGFWLRIVANHFNCARSSLEPLMASSVSDTAASGSSGRSSTSRCSPPRTKTPRRHTPMSWESDGALLSLPKGNLNCEIVISRCYLQDHPN